MKKLRFEDSKLSKADWNTLKALNTPGKIQDFLNSLSWNHDKTGMSHMSVAMTLKARKAHCFEGALVGALALWIQGQKPLLLDLKTVRPDFDHVVTLFKVGNYWGAISKTNHSVLRYRDPIYKSVRELVMSYFHEYFLDNGKKTLRNYSKPYDLSKGAFDKWLSGEENLAWLAHELDQSPHLNIITKIQVKNLRKAEEIEVKASNIT
ncbi:hypothetical protein KW807_01385 [Candidatus Parcubacteria bacterium]|nr:hypothetical protein [Candidatus Parcubacteria bacterium]